MSGIEWATCSSFNVVQVFDSEVAQIFDSENLRFDELEEMTGSTELTKVSAEAPKH